MWSEFEQFIEDNSLISPSDHILLAASGGVDSMTLAHLFLRKSINFEIAHVNFQLRGEDSAADEAFVLNWGNHNGIAVHTRRFSVAEKLKGESVQQFARRVRYDWFEQLMREEGFSRLATAHHATDNVETLFINILRGAGVRGWSGIPMKRGKIIRPLLFAEKSQIVNYANDEGIAHREDASNWRDDYLRNKIRLHILPELAAISPGCEQRISANQMQLNRASELLDVLVADRNKSAVSVNEDVMEIDLAKIEPRSFALDILYHLLRHTQLSKDQIRSAWQSEISGKLYTSPGYELLVDRDRWLVRQRRDTISSLLEAEVCESDTELNHPIRLRMGQLSAINFTIPKDPHVAAMDMDVIDFPLHIRPWREGDRFVPLGMEGQKLVSDFLIDSKVDRFSKGETFVVESNGKIVWVVGHRISNLVKVSVQTRKVFVLTLVE